MAQEGMFWKLVPEDVFGEPAEITSADDGFMWRVKKDKMEVATGVTWTECIGSKNVAVERKIIERILGDIR